LNLRSAEEVLRWGCETYGIRFAIVSSFQKEGVILIDMAARLGLTARVITIDTGRLPAETLAMIDTVESRYNMRVERLRPEPAELERMTRQFGPDLFRDEVALRKLCCQVRKVRPLDIAMIGLDAYAVGLRREQSESRQDTELVALVDGRQKLSPLAAWTSADVESYLRQHSVPIHPLYASGYATIGCAPCSRPVQAGEDLRAGRWWWELEGDKECGLHFTPEGKIERRLDVLLRDVVGTHA